jgi:hypothetical protein
MLDKHGLTCLLFQEKLKAKESPTQGTHEHATMLVAETGHAGSVARWKGKLLSFKKETQGYSRLVYQTSQACSQEGEKSEVLSLKQPIALHVKTLTL